ncbi:metallopeptidase family protein [Pseudarthrobacter sp. S9]|uniref:metallopeptidase family protein n=1 Tax=Pseudarthrobacter sp. S9 TaxID=3418421 RepID=UPI003D06E777
MQSSHHDSGFTVRLADPDAGRPGAGSASAGAPATGATGAAKGKSFPQRRRNRHGRGLRGELMLPTLPGYRTRSDRFDDLVLDSAQRLHDIWGKPLDGVRFGVDEIPPGLERLVADRTPAPMGSYSPATAEEGPVITLYRRVVEQSCGSREELQDLVHDVVVEYTAEMLGVPPESLDPVYRRRY